MIFSFYSSSFACLEPKLDRLEDWSIFVGIWAIRSVAQDSRQQVDDVCDYFWLNLSLCFLWMIKLWLDNHHHRHHYCRNHPKTLIILLTNIWDVFATANLDWTRFLRHTLQKYVTANTKISKNTNTMFIQCSYMKIRLKIHKITILI